jgi:N-glycosylase/DNA lyase
MKELLEIYRRIKPEINRRRKEFKENRNLSDEELKQFLVFSLCTPQSSAKKCWAAIKSFSPQKTEKQIAQILGDHGVRFKNNKAGYIKKFYQNFSKKSFKNWLRQNLSFGIKYARMCMTEICGIGMKEASHFLRNVGWGEELCILDRHIMKNLQEYGILISGKTLTTKRYLEYEVKMKEFAKKIKIPVLDLDFVFWFRNNKEIQVY